MKNLTSSFSISQKPKPDDLIVSINSRKEILFDKKTKNFFHKVPHQLPSQIFKIFEDNNLNIFLVEELGEINEECEYLSKKFLYSHLDENSLILISRAFQIYDWIYKQKFCSRTGNKLSEVREDLSKFCDS